MKELIVTANEAGQRLDKLLAKYLCEAPKSFIYKMLRKKNITLNGKKASGNEKLSPSDKVTFFFSDETIEKFTKGSFKKASGGISILYEDEHILFINKEAGTLSQKAAATDESLVEQLITYLLNSGQMKEEQLKVFRPSICNRLDRNTSGIVAAGKSLQGLQEMGELFKTRGLKKYYRCIVAGTLSKNQYLKGYLCKDEKRNQVTITPDERVDSLPIETAYIPISAGASYTLLEVHLITGRTHQIRAHLSSIGHPIIGDYKYGDKKQNDKLKVKYQLEHQLLHAYRLELPTLSGALSGISGKTFVAPLTRQFQRIIEEEGL